MIPPPVIKLEKSVTERPVVHLVRVHLLNQPAQYLTGSTAELHELQAGEAHDDEEAVKRYTILGAVTQCFRCATFKRQSVQAAGGAVSVGVAGTENRGHHQGVDDVRKDRDAHVGHRDDIGRCSGRLHASLLDLRERGVVVREDNAGAEGAHDEEETETPVDGLEGVLDVDARALGFGSHHGDVLGSNDTEGLRKHQKSAFFFFGSSPKRPPLPLARGATHS